MITKAPSGRELSSVCETEGEGVFITLYFSGDLAYQTQDPSVLSFAKSTSIPKGGLNEDVCLYNNKAKQKHLWRNYHKCFFVFNVICFIVKYFQIISEFYLCRYRLQVP